ncbi:hypothetical protein KM92CIT3_120022 [uncultured Citrobacter sp.]|uniref:Uncharacterized protein n=1 Tax=uncultured Citrobacter sp. TaxID=200446 RepID=A0A212I378_9ENTR|nr:hypothetical protein KM92CIT3_120022 [uncultured Citrobacter sp.]
MPLHFTANCYHIATLIVNSSNYFALLIVCGVNVLNLYAVEIDGVPFNTGINLPAWIAI